MNDTKIIKLQQEVESATSSSDKATTLNLLSWRYCELSQYDEAISSAESALEISRKANNFEIEGDALNILGDIAGKLGNFQSALEYFQNAISISLKYEVTYSLGATHCNCGNIYKAMHNYENALYYYNRACVYFSDANHTFGLATSLGNIGNVYHLQKEYEKALDFHQQALALHEKMDDRLGIATIYSNIGNAYFELNNYENALKFHLKALTLDTELSDVYGIAIHNGNIGKVYAHQNFTGYNPDIAESYLLKAGESFREIGNKKLVYEYHRVLADHYRDQKRWEDSDREFRIYHFLEHEVQSEEAKKQAEEMERRRKIEEAERDRQVKLARFQEREKILDNILPSQITERLIKGEQPIADKAENVSVFFSDIVGFTTLSQKVTAKELVSGLNELFIQYDMLAKQHGLEKIKTIGDAYMAVCGVPIAAADHAYRTAQFALGIQDLFAQGIMIAGHSVNVRIGLHCGEVVAGVIGEQKFAYDLWGDAVNTASRMESHGEAGRIHCSEDFKNALVETQHLASLQTTFTERGKMEIKGKGKMRTYFLEKHV